MDKKRMASVLMVFLLVLSLLVVAEEEPVSDPCSGFFGSISCFLWGNPENRAGRGWFERGNTVGEAGAAAALAPTPSSETPATVPSTQGSIIIGGTTNNYEIITRSDNIEFQGRTQTYSAVFDFGNKEYYVNLQGELIGHSDNNGATKRFLDPTDINNDPLAVQVQVKEKQFITETNAYIDSLGLSLTPPLSAGSLGNIGVGTFSGQQGTRIFIPSRQGLSPTQTWTETAAGWTCRGSDCPSGSNIPQRLLSLSDLPGQASLTTSPQPAPPPRPPGPPDGSQKIEGTDYSLGPDGEFYNQKGEKVNAHKLLQQQRITHNQIYAMLDRGAQLSESRVLENLPGGTQVHYQGNTYQYKNNQWQTTDDKAAPAGLSAAVVQGEAQVTQPTILTNLPGGGFTLGNQQYTYSSGNWHTGGADGAVISAADLQTKLLASGTSGSGAPPYLPPTVTGNDELQNRITALKNQRSQIEAAKKARQEADSQMWAGSWFEFIQTSQGYQDVKYYASTAGDIASVMQRGGKYQALSNALFGRETSRTWLLNADNEFLTTWANLPSFAATHGPLTPDACKLDDARRTEIPGSSSQFVQTAGGSYQFVGAIQAEKTLTTQPVLCKRNDDPQMESEFVCRTGQVCVDDTFCHLDTDDDAEPDSDEPVKGYFYKITWGVAAPADESFTPYIDEDHKAVKFNIQLVATDSSIWLYNRAGVTGTGVIALENGARDRNVITHFSSRIFQKACIRYDPRYLVKDRDGTKVEDQCVDIITRDGGSVEFSGSRRTESVTTTSAEVSSNADW